MTSSYHGYSGFYKDNYLRSCLEYIYAKYLDYMNIGWIYEPKTYTLSSGIRYKPDFLLENGEYIEIKGSFNYKESLPKVQCFESDYKVKITILQEPDLRVLIKNTPLIFEHLKDEWKVIAKMRGMDITGKKNPMYGIKQTEDTISKIRAKAVERFADPEFKEKFLNSSKRKAYHLRRTGVKTGEVAPRFTIHCKFCGEGFVVIQGKVDKSKFCSYSCSVQASYGKTKTTNSEVQSLVYQFALENEGLLLTVKLNKLKGLFQPLYDSILEKHNIKDIRTISEMVTGERCSRKEILYYLRDYVQKVRGAIENKESIELEDKKLLG